MILHSRPWANLYFLIWDKFVANFWMELTLNLKHCLMIHDYLWLICDNLMLHPKLLIISVQTKCYHTTNFCSMHFEYDVKYLHRIPRCNRAHWKKYCTHNAGQPTWPIIEMNQLKVISHSFWMIFSWPIGWTWNSIPLVLSSILTYCTILKGYSHKYKNSVTNEVCSRITQAHLSFCKNHNEVL